MKIKKNYNFVTVILNGLLVIFFHHIVTAQPFHPENNEAFLQEEIASIYITIHPDSLAVILNQNNLYSNHEFPATFRYISSTTDTTIQQVGFRLRGNTSRNANKKSFKISFNTFFQGRKWEFLEKLNLNGQHNDVSMLRSYLSAKVLVDAGLPASRVSFVKLFVNNEYKGLYLNTEHIDEEFIQWRFPSNTTGNLYKCAYGSALQYAGSNQANYENLYELKTNKNENDYSELIAFLNVLNNAPNSTFACDIQAVFDVDLYLQTLAIEILSGHWDGPTYNKNNFYLYQRPTDGRFVLISYDMDNTFGIDWVNQNWENRNIYNWSPSNDSRPLYERILNVPYFKQRFSAYVHQYVNSFYTYSNLYPHLQQMQDFIANALAADVYRTMDYGFDQNDFQEALTSNWGGHVKSGIATFILYRRTAAINQLVLGNLSNPCGSLGITPVDFDPNLIVKTTNLLGQVIENPLAGQLYLQWDAHGNTRKIIFQPE